MTQNMPERLDVKIDGSKQFNQLVDVLYACAFVACWLNDLPKECQWLFSSLVVVFWAIRSISNHSPQYLLRYTANIGWALSVDDINYREILILNDTVITHFAIFLSFKTKEQLMRSRSIMIMHDSVLAPDYRRLIVRLKLSL